MSVKSINDFSGNTITFMTGMAIAQALPIAASPILTRLYSPDDFGVLSLFVSISTIFGIIANGRYEMAIMLQKTEEDACNMAALGLSIATLLSLFLFAIILIFGDEIVKMTDHQNIKLWLYFIPLSVFLIGLYNVLNYYNNRVKKYKNIAHANICKSIILISLQMIIGVFKAGSTGLITGQIISNLVSTTIFLKRTIRIENIKKKIRISKIKDLAIRYKDFPKYSLWAILANTLSKNVINVAIPLLFSLASLGYYALVQRVLGIPFLLVGNSIGQVFFQKAVTEKERSGKAVKVYDATTIRLCGLALPVFIFCFIIIEHLFALIFGEEWRIAGRYAKILIPLFAIRLIVVSVSHIANVFEKQRVFFVWQILMLFLTVSIIFVTMKNDFSFEKFLYIYSIVMSGHYMVLYFLLRYISKGLI